MGKNHNKGKSITKRHTLIITDKKKLETEQRTNEAIFKKKQGKAVFILKVAKLVVYRVRSCGARLSFY